jgi:hypothetical protein
MFGKGALGTLIMVMKISLDGHFFLIAPFVFGIQRCCWKLSFGTLIHGHEDFSKWTILFGCSFDFGIQRWFFFGG